MESMCCGNPLDIRYHYRHKTAYLGISVVDEKFNEKYASVCENLKVGLKVCSQCKTMIENSLPICEHQNCVDPFEIGAHSSENFSKVSVNTQQLFSSYRNKLPLGTFMCRQCYENLGKLTKKRENKLSSQDLCCNPFNKTEHKSGKNFRIVTEQMVNKLSNDSVQINANDKLYSSCRAGLYRNIKITPYDHSEHQGSPFSTRSR